MPLPRWNSPAFAQGLDFSLEENFEIPHSDFINFFQDITIETMDIRHRYPAIARATVFLRSSHDPADNEDRLMCLFYIALVLRSSKQGKYDPHWLNDSLQKTEDLWGTSIKSLRWLLLQGMGRGPEGPDAMSITGRLESVAKALQECPWRRMEDRLLSLILGPEETHDSGDILMEDSLSS